MAGLTVTAVREVVHTPERVYGFLAHIDNHWRLDNRYLRLQGLDDDQRGGRIVIAGPLGLRRTARTTVTTEHRPHRFGGVATVGGRTSARVHWSIEPTERGARVMLESTISSAGMLDRSLLAIGGRWWLRRAFRRALEGLAEAVDAYCAAPPPAPLPAPAMA